MHPFPPSRCAEGSWRLTWGSAPHPGSVACGDPNAPRRSLAGARVRAQPVTPLPYADGPWQLSGWRKRVRNPRFAPHNGLALLAQSPAQPARVDGAGRDGVDADLRAEGAGERLGHV